MYLGRSTITFLLKHLGMWYMQWFKLKRLSDSSTHAMNMCRGALCCQIIMHAVSSMIEWSQCFPVFRVSVALTSLIRWILRIRWPFTKPWNSRQSPSLKLVSR